MSINEILLFSKDKKFIENVNEFKIPINIIKLDKNIINFKIMYNQFDFILIDIEAVNNFKEFSNEMIFLKRNINKKIILLVDEFDEEIIKRAFLCRITDIIKKNDLRKLKFSINYYLDKDLYEHPFNMILDDYINLKKNEVKSILSNAEIEILDYVEKGYSRLMISKCLYKSQGTVKSQINKLLKKLKVKNTQDAVYKINTFGF
jgi:NarL family two-component system response regulator LiaR